MVVDTQKERFHFISLAADEAAEAVGAAGRPLFGHFWQTDSFL